MIVFTAWLAFADVLRPKLWPNAEYYGQELTNFLGNSCMPGIQDLDREPYPVGINFDKLCSLCGSDPTVQTGKFEIILNAKKLFTSPQTYRQ